LQTATEECVVWHIIYSVIQNFMTCLLAFDRFSGDILSARSLDGQSVYARTSMVQSVPWPGAAWRFSLHGIHVGRRTPIVMWYGEGDRALRVTEGR
jgi:hypothetical protein